MNLFKKKKKKELSLDETKINLKNYKVSIDIEKELIKLPRKRRKRALELLKMYEKGQLLKPNEDVDNKKIIMEKK